MGQLGGRVGNQGSALHGALFKSFWRAQSPAPSQKTAKAGRLDTGGRGGADPQPLDGGFARARRSSLLLLTDWHATASGRRMTNDDSVVVALVAGKAVLLRRIWLADGGLA